MVMEAGEPEIEAAAGLGSGKSLPPDSWIRNGHLRRRDEGALWGVL